MFSKKTLKNCLIQRLFFLSVYSIYVLKLGMYRKLYMKLKVEGLLAHTKSQYQDIKILSFGLSSAVAEDKSYLTFFLQSHI